MVHNFQDYINAEHNRREEFKKEILEMVYACCTIGDGRIRKGILQRAIYNALGFHGKPGTNFARFLSKLLLEEGFRNGSCGGQAYYFGLVSKTEPIIHSRNYNYTLIDPALITKTRKIKL